MLETLQRVSKWRSTCWWTPMKAIYMMDPGQPHRGGGTSMCLGWRRRSAETTSSVRGRHRHGEEPLPGPEWQRGTQGESGRASEGESWPCCLPRFTRFLGCRSPKVGSDPAGPIRATPASRSLGEGRDAVHCGMAPQGREPAGLRDLSKNGHHDER